MLAIERDRKAINAFATSSDVLGLGLDIHLLDGLHYEDGVFWFWNLGLLVKFVQYWLVDRKKSCDRVDERGI